MFRFAQLTDIHIGGTPEQAFGVDTRATFRRTLDAALRWRPHEIVITGDLSFRDPDPDAYEWIRTEIDAAGVAYSVIPGNHDDARLMGAEFREHSVAPSFDRVEQGHPVCFLDTESGTVAEGSNRALQSICAEPGPEAVVFMHHPPCLVGVPCMDDRHALRDHKAVSAAWSSVVRPHSVFCGHYHVDRTVRLGAMTVHATPSTFFQIDANHEEFAVDHLQPAFRIIDLYPREIRTSVHYLRASEPSAARD